MLLAALALLTLIGAAGWMAIGDPISERGSPPNDESDATTAGATDERRAESASSDGVARTRRVHATPEPKPDRVPADRVDASGTSSPPVSQDAPPAVRLEGGAPLIAHRLFLREIGTGRTTTLITGPGGELSLPEDMPDTLHDVLAVDANVPGDVLVSAEPVRPSDVQAGRARIGWSERADVTFACRNDAGELVGATIELRLGSGKDGPLVRSIRTGLKRPSRFGPSSVKLPIGMRFTAVLANVRVLSQMPMVRQSTEFVVPGTFGQEVAFRILQPSTLTVRLEDENGAPLPNIVIGSKSFDDRGVQFAASATTDATGTAVLRKLKVGALTVLVNAAGRPAIVEHVSLAPAEDRELTLVVPSGGVTVQARIVGVPADHIRQLNLAYRSAPVAEAFVVTTTEIGEDGAVRLQGLRPGRYDFHVMLKDGQHGFRRLLIEDAVTKLGEIDVSALEDTGTANVGVTAAVEGWRRGYYWGQVHKDDWPEGFWRFVLLKERTATNVALSPGTYSFRITPESNTTDGFRTVQVAGVAVHDDAETPPQIELRPLPR